MRDIAENCSVHGSGRFTGAAEDIERVRDIGREKCEDEA